jgi:hypothetical protein
VFSMQSPQGLDGTEPTGERSEPDFDESQLDEENEAFEVV